MSTRLRSLVEHGWLYLYLRCPSHHPSISVKVLITKNLYSTLMLHKLTKLVPISKQRLNCHHLWMKTRDLRYLEAFRPSAWPACSYSCFLYGGQCHEENRISADLRENSWRVPRQFEKWNSPTFPDHVTRFLQTVSDATIKFYVTFVGFNSSILTPFHCHYSWLVNVLYNNHLFFFVLFTRLYLHH